MKVRITEDGDIPQLKKLWKAIFDFDGGYTELFFKYRYPTCQGIGLFDGDKLLSAQYLIPCKLNIGDACFDIKYVFAVATFPELQGRGYNTFLLNETEKYAHKNNIAGMALMPANEGLFDYYRKVGYETAFYAKKQEYKVLKEKKEDFLSCSLKDQFSLREEYFKKCDGFLSWDSKALDYCGKDIEFSGGKILSFPNICEGYAVCKFSQDSVLVKELVCPKEFTDKVINGLGNYFCKKKVFTIAPSNNRALPYGMLLSCCENLKKASLGKNLYMSLPMD